MKLFHRDLGGAGRPPLVVLHGMLGSARNWQSAGRDLAENFHVLAPDLRNHGGSPHAAEMGYADMAGDVLAWLDREKLGRVTLAGHSMGGKIAMLLACHRPERVAALVVADIAPKNYFWPGRRTEFAAMTELDVRTIASRAEAERRFEERVPSLGMRKFMATNLDRDAEGRWRWIVNLPVVAAALPTLEANPLGAEDRFAGPVLFIAGGKSAYLAAADHAAIWAHFPAARIETLPEAGHNPHLEAREKFVALVRDFTASS